jgi:colicin import membrane protein
MAREENSLLFSLKELQNLEQDRLREEDDARLAAIESERRAKEAAEQRIRDEEAARIQAAKDAEKRAREEAERKAMEDRIRLEEADRRAHIEAQAAKEEALLRAAAEAIRTKPIPWGIISGVAAALIALSILIVVIVNRQQVAAKNEARAQLIARLDAERKRDKDEAARLQKNLSDKMAEVQRLNDMVNGAKNEQERIEAAKLARDAAGRASRAAADADAQRKAAKEREKRAKLERCKNSDDPLCGVN